MKNTHKNFTLKKFKREKLARCLSIVFLVLLLAGSIYSQKTVGIPMRDGIKLTTNLYFPRGEDGPFPVILMRTPYNKEILKGYGDYFSERGYVYAIQDVRGRFESQGKWEPFINEREDGYDSIEWLAAQEWSTGKIGMYGGSYSGVVQFAAAVLKPPHLITILPNITPAMPFENMPYEGGVLVMGGDIRWVNVVEKAKTVTDMQKIARETFTKDWNSLLNLLPVIDLDKKILEKETPYWRRWVKHNTNDSYWEKVNYLEELQDLDIPVFLQSGWYDPGNRGTKLAYFHLKQSKNKNIKMIIGPWEHTDQSSKYLYGQDLGDAADIGLMDLYLRWFDYWLKGEDNGIIEEPLVQVFNFGPNNWLKADAYPLPNTSFVKYHISSEKGANTSRGDGKLQLEISSSSREFDTYIYDPGDLSPCFIDFIKKRALANYKDLLVSRDDVLVYETAPFDQPLTIAGPISTVLYASSSAKDTDWCVTLYAVDREGEISPIGMTWGLLRARFRNSMSKPEFLEKDKVYKFIIDLSHTGYTFSQGERIRMEISSALFPEYSRNLNTGGHNEMETEYVSAAQKIYHSEEFPSHLLLPVFETDVPMTPPEPAEEDETRKDKSPYAPYFGKYSHPELGDMKVVEKKGKLGLDIPNRAVLTFNDADKNGIWICVLSNKINLKFSRDETGEVNGLTLSIKTSLPKKADAESIGADVPKEFRPYLGLYPVPMEGTELAVVFKHGGLAVVESGKEAVELLGPGEDGFWIYKSSGYKISFAFGGDGNVKEMIIHQIFDAPKVKFSPLIDKNSLKKESDR
ncbi:MAG: CocE/NonD family hydrolase [Candidatus Aminicenantes bacterium]|nr:CocE/NonD family hydrolase [Candidatus Aminicenantes bacterium]